MKRWLKFTLAVCLCLSLIPVTARAQAADASPDRPEESLFTSWEPELVRIGNLSLRRDMPENSCAWLPARSFQTAELEDFRLDTAHEYLFLKFSSGGHSVYLALQEGVALRIGYETGGGIRWQSMENKQDVRLAMFGDSVMAGQLGGKPPYTITKHLISDTVAEELGITVTNFGVGSMGWISRQYLDRNAEDYIPRVDLSGYDAAVFFFGLNDGDTPLGRYTDTTEHTIMGAVYRVCDYLHREYPRLKIILSTPTPCKLSGTFPDWGFTVPHEASDGWTFEQMRDEYRLFCDLYHIPLIEADKCFSSWELPELMGDHVHPTEEGYIVAGQYIAGQLSALF